MSKILKATRRINIAIIARHTMPVVCQTFTAYDGSFLLEISDSFFHADDFLKRQRKHLAVSYHYLSLFFNSNLIIEK